MVRQGQFSFFFRAAFVREEFFSEMKTLKKELIVWENTKLEPVRSETSTQIELYFEIRNSNFKLIRKNTDVYRITNGTYIAFKLSQNF